MTLPADHFPPSPDRGILHRLRRPQLRLIEQVPVRVQGEAWGAVPEEAGYLMYGAALRDQQAREGVAAGVRRPAGGDQPRSRRPDPAPPVRYIQWAGAMGRGCVGIDGSAEYLEIAARRTRQLSLLGGAA